LQSTIILPVAGQTTARHFLVENQWQRLAQIAIENEEGLVCKDVGVEDGSVGSSEIVTSLLKQIGSKSEETFL